MVATNTEELLPLPEAAERLGVSIYTVRRWIKDGKLRAFRPGKEYRVREVDLEEFLAAREVRPKEVTSPSQRSLFDGLEEERRLHYLKPWSKYVNLLANNVEREIDKGHVTDLNWWQEFSRDVISLINLYYEIRPPDAEQSEAERLELHKFSTAIDRLEEVAEKMARAMEPVIAEMHKELYARERERIKAAFNAIPGRKSA